MVILVCGGREFDDYRSLCAALDRLHARRAVTLVIHGAARGADALAGRWARLNGIPERPFPADWSGYAKHRAGPIRNQKMLDEGRPELVVAFPGGRGTADMVGRSERAGVQVWRPRLLPAG